MKINYFSYLNSYTKMILIRRIKHLFFLILIRNDQVIFSIISKYSLKILFLNTMTTSLSMWASRVSILYPKHLIHN